MPIPPPLLLTRPEAASARFADQWRARMGPEAPVVIAPVLALEILPGAPALDGYAGAVFTSETGVAALGAEGRGLRAWCVGPHTAAAARAMGFDARAAEGDAESLVATVIASGERGPFLHLRGREARGEVAPRLQAAGIACDEVVVYAQRPRPLSPEAKALLAGEGPVLVPLFSTNSATRLGAEAAGGRAPLLLAAISDVVAGVWSGPAPRRIEVAERPDAPAMIAALARLAALP